MKKIYYLIFLAIGLSGCSVESLDSTEELTTADAKFSSFSTVTITPTSGPLCAGEELIFSVDVNTSSNFQVQQKINGEWVQVYMANKGQNGSMPFTVVLELGSNEFRYTNQGSGANFINYSSTFEGIDCNTCENSLIANFSCGDTRTATFTFTAEEAGAVIIQGGLTSGTTILEASSNVLNRNLTHSSVTNSKSNVTRWEGNVDACEVVMITITFSGGNGIGDWSAKRGEEVLGATEDMACN